MPDGGNVSVALGEAVGAMTDDLDPVVHSFEGAVRHAELGSGEDAGLLRGQFRQVLQHAREPQETSWVVNHNQTYVLLKHLGWPRSLAFLAYTLGVRDENTIAVPRVPCLALRRRWSSAAIKAQFAGKIAGIRSYLNASRGREKA